MRKNKAVSNFHWIEIEYKEDDEGDYIPCFDYRGSTYSLDEFMRFDNKDDDDYWEGYLTTSNFGGLVVKLSDDGDAVQVGRS